MKKIFLYFCISIIFNLVFESLIFSPEVFSQSDQKSLYAVTDYLKVKPENINSYLELEQNIWKPMHAERVRLGIIIGWYLYAINFTGTNNEYNYVTIVVYDNIDNLEHPWSTGIPATVHPDKEVVDILKESNVVCSRVRSEMYERITSAPDRPMEKPSPYVQVNYMRVPQGRSDDYERIEREVWQPIHEELVRREKISGWGLWSLVYPRGDELAYQYLTLDGVPKFSDLFGLNYSEVFETVHPEMSNQEISEVTNQSRATARTELWELIDYVIQ